MAAHLDVSTLQSTRRALHGVAELLLAGPQYRASGTIRLRVRPGGLATVAAPDLRIDGVEIVADGRRAPLDGATCAGLGQALGVDVGAPGNYTDGSGVAVGEPLHVDADAARHLTEALAMGDDAMRRFAPDAEPVLWPEHFDVGISVDEVNYGVSPGDGTHPEPYAYVGPWQARRGGFWNAPFGASRAMRDLASVDAVLGFYVEGRARAAADPVRQ